VATATMVVARNKNGGGGALNDCQRVILESDILDLEVQVIASAPSDESSSKWRLIDDVNVIPCCILQQKEPLTTLIHQ